MDKQGLYKKPTEFKNSNIKVYYDKNYESQGL